MIRLVFSIFGLSIFLCQNIYSINDDKTQHKVKKSNNKKEEIEQYSPNQFPSDPIIIPVLQKNRLKAYYLFEIIFDLDDSQNKKFIKKFKNRVIDKIITTIYGVSYSFWSESQPLLKEQIEKLIFNEVTNIFPKDQKTNIIVKNFQMIKIDKNQQDIYEDYS